MQDSEPDHDSASAIVDAEGPGPQSAGAPEADAPFRPVSEMSERESRHWAREVNRLYPRVNRWPS